LSDERLTDITTHLTVDGGGITVIDLGGGQTVIITGISSPLQPQDFIFHP
jgi:hypothetical protein